MRSLAAQVIELVLPWPPTGNSYVRHTRSGGHYLTQAVKTFRLEVWHEAKQKHIQMIRGRLSLSVLAHPPDKRRRDLDNLFKCLGDALQHAGVVADDSQFDSYSIKRMPVIKGGCLVCQITELDGKPIY